MISVSQLSNFYNPFSLLNALSKQRIEDYWFRTGAPSYLVRLLDRYDENLDDIVGKWYSAGDFIDYKADKEMPLPMIYQSGYLTILEYDMDTNSYMLDFPNDEVRRGFVKVVAGNYFNVSSGNTTSTIVGLVKALKAGELDVFRTQLTSFLASIPYFLLCRNRLCG